MVSHGYGKILDIDLSSGNIKKKNIDPRFAQKYLGGIGFGSRILYDEVGPNVDPLSPENVLIFAVGPLTGSRTPGGSRTEITTKHPLSGSIGTGNTGGRWGSALKHAGYDVVIIRNKAEKPVYIIIDNEKVEIRDAANLWGKDTWETSDIIPDSASNKIPVIAIGQAGENLVRHACLLNDRYHAAGRCGGGAVMGAKLLKAIAVKDNGSPPLPARPDEFQTVLKEARNWLIAADKAFWSTGPHAPPYSLAMTRMDGAESLSQTEVEKYVTGRLPGCYACPVTCYNGIAEVKHGKYAGLVMGNAQRPAIIGYFGGVCGINNLPAVWKCKELCNRLGMDFYSAAGIIAFTIELYNNGIITKSDTDGLEMTYGNEDAIIKMLQKIAFREGFGNVLADGSERAASRIGSGAERHLLTIKGIETGGRDPRPSAAGELDWQFLGHLTNPRGGDIIKTTHHHANQYNPAWWVEHYDMFEDIKEKIYGKPPVQKVTSWQGQSSMYKWFEDLHSLVDSVGLCFVTSHMRLAFGPNYISKLYSAYTGTDISPEEMMETAERIFTMFKMSGVRQGFSRKEDNWPDRYYDEPVSEGKYKGFKLSREAVDKLLDGYYTVRGWDKITGIPTKEKLIQLGLEDVARGLERGKET